MLIKEINCNSSEWESIFELIMNMTINQSNVDVKCESKYESNKLKNSTNMNLKIYETNVSLNVNQEKSESKGEPAWV